MARKPGSLHVPEILAVREDVDPEARRRRGSVISGDALSIYLKGGPRYRLDGHTYRFKPPIGILIPRGTFDADRQEGPVEGIFVLFQGHGLLRKPDRDSRRVVVALEKSKLAVPELKEISGAEGVELAGFLRQIAAISDATLGGQMRRVSLLFQAIARYAEIGGEGKGHGVHREATRLRELIAGWAFENVPMERIYQELDLSADHAGMLFRRAFGVSPVKYRMQVRLQRARELLVSSKRNVSQAAYAVGFTDPLYFTRVFREQFGVTPSSLIYEFDTTRK